MVPGERHQVLPQGLFDRCEQGVAGLGQFTADDDHAGADGVTDRGEDLADLAADAIQHFQCGPVGRRR